MQVRTKATHQQTRAYNQGLVLRTLYDRGPVSRADVARMTGLTRTTVSDVVAEFLTDGLVREVGRGPSSGGKAPILLQVVEDARLLIGLDLGEREFTAALVDLRGEIRRVERTPVEGRDGDAALDAVYRLVDTLVADNPGVLLGIGVGTPGLVDTDTGTIRWAVNLDWQDLPLGALLRKRYDLPTYVANDSRAAALGEYLFAGEGRAPNLIAIKVGQGIGAGIVLGGELFAGDSHGAGEIGHTTAVEGGSICRCGRYGCLETVASSHAILEATGAATLAEVRLRLDAGERDSIEAVRSAGRALGGAVGALIGALNVNRIHLIGSVPALGDIWLEAVRDEARRRSLGLLAEATEIERGRAVEHVVALGATALLMTRELGLVPQR